MPDSTNQMLKALSSLSEELTQKRVEDSSENLDSQALQPDCIPQAAPELKASPSMEDVLKNCFSKDNLKQNNPME